MSYKLGIFFFSQMEIYRFKFKWTGSHWEIIIYFNGHKSLWILAIYLTHLSSKGKHDFSTLNMRESDKKSKYNISHSVILEKNLFLIYGGSSVEKTQTISTA
jgi:hypothetical protein